MNTTSNLSELMQTYWDKMFLKRVEQLTILNQFAQQRPLPKNNGKIIQWCRYSNLATATTALTEGVNPTGSNLTAANVSAQIAEYGDWISISSLVSKTAIDPEIGEKVAILGTQSGETLEELMSDVLGAGGTEQIVSTKASLATITATDVLTSVDIKKAVRTLKINRAMPFDGNTYACLVNPYTEYDFFNDTTWLAASEYSDIMNLYKGEIGQWFGTRFVLGTMPYREGTNGVKNRTSGAVFHNPVLGREAFGVTTIEGRKPNIIIKTPGPQDTSNALNRFGTAGWEIEFVTKVLNANFIINIKTGATA